MWKPQQIICSTAREIKDKHTPWITHIRHIHTIFTLENPLESDRPAEHRETCVCVCVWHYPKMSALFSHLLLLYGLNNSTWGRILISNYIVIILIYDFNISISCPRQYLDQMNSRFSIMSQNFANFGIINQK